MKSITELLRLHTAPGVRFAEERRVCAGVLQTVLGIPISPDQISCEHEMLSLSLPPVVKSAALTKKTEILALLTSAGVSVVDMR